MAECSCKDKDKEIKKLKKLIGRALDVLKSEMSVVDRLHRAKELLEDVDKKPFMMGVGK